MQGILQARTLEWTDTPSSRGSSGPSNRTGVSCIAGGFFTNRSTRKAFSPSWAEQKLQSLRWIPNVPLLGPLVSSLVSPSLQRPPAPYPSAHRPPLSCSDPRVGVSSNPIKPGSRAYFFGLPQTTVSSTPHTVQATVPCSPGNDNSFPGPVYHSCPPPQLKRSL